MENKATDRESVNQTYHLAQDKMMLLPNYYAWIYSYFSEFISGSVVELGVGAGFMVQQYIHAADRVVAVDFNQKLLDLVRLHFPAEKVVPLQIDLKKQWDLLYEMAADVVLAFDVLEHFEDEDDFTNKAYNILKTNGKLIIKVPAQSSLFCDMDVASGHFRRYDEAPLSDLMMRNGFKTIYQRYMNPVGALAYRMKKNKSQNFSRSVSAYTLRLANVFIPALRLLDRIPHKIGLSIIGIYEKI